MCTVENKGVEIVLPCSTCAGECCSQAVPFTKAEVKIIKKKYPTMLKKVSVVKMDGLPGFLLKKKGTSFTTQDIMNDNIGQCVFYNNGCGIYDDRPKVCKDFGVIPEMKCPYAVPKESLDV